MQFADVIGYAGCKNHSFGYSFPWETGNRNLKFLQSALRNLHVPGLSLSSSKQYSDLGSKTYTHNWFCEVVGGVSNCFLQTMLQL